MMNIERKPFGKTARGEAVTLFEIRTPELTADSGLRCDGAGAADAG